MFFKCFQFLVYFRPFSVKLFLMQTVTCTHIPPPASGAHGPTPLQLLHFPSTHLVILLTRIFVLRPFARDTLFWLVDIGHRKMSNMTAGRKGKCLERCHPYDPVDFFLWPQFRFLCVSVQSREHGNILDYP